MMPHHHHHHHNHDLRAAADLEDQKIRRMKLALDSSDVELVKLMVMEEGLNLYMELALHYICSRKLGGEVVKALLELGAGDMNYPAGPARKYPASHCFRNGVSRHGGSPTRPPRRPKCPNSRWGYSSGVKDSNPMVEYEDTCQKIRKAVRVSYIVT
ncbi:hypothetical protein ACFX13_009304 [Malus domestica]